MNGFMTMDKKSKKVILLTVKKMVLGAIGMKMENLKW